ncbi:oligoribonuclease [Candidatus Nitromaritima sp. SCGC AAA799-A02]|nr:oligoribonuclease [Candidatus Nitromaritima sp. SCGC AAA799-C22]KMP11980.1 oligoribonuclease [Candidatus Nitromaritima sp. SCGC AAA799-A02]
MENQSPLNLVWIDLEMTGLDPDLEVIIEIASLVTDCDLNLIAEGPCLAVHQSDDILGRMDDWNKKHHNASGLVERVRKSRITAAEAERQSLEFIKQYAPPKTAPLCGNSITLDRKFLCKYMKELHNYLHYRSVDVTSVKELVRRWYPDGPKLPKKSESHMASVDVRESLEELIFYRKHYFTSNGLTNPKIFSTQENKT